jgi:hypothetical protein
MNVEDALQYRYQDEANVGLGHGEESYEHGDSAGGAVYEVDRDWDEEHHLRGRKEAEAVDEEGGDHQIHQYDWPSRAVNDPSSSIPRRLPQDVDNPSTPIHLQTADRYYQQQYPQAPADPTQLPSPFLRRSSLNES